MAVSHEVLSDRGFEEFEIPRDFRFEDFVSRMLAPLNFRGTNTYDTLFIDGVEIPEIHEVRIGRRRAEIETL